MTDPGPSHSPFTFLREDLQELKQELRDLRRIGPGYSGSPISSVSRRSSSSP
jgi:hypothetical protein